MSNRILVTGAAGFIGSHVARHLIDNHDNIVHVALRTKAVEIGPNSELRRHTPRYVAGDLLFPTVCKALTKDIDTVIHCAAESHGANVMAHDPAALVTPNIVMNAQLLDAAWRAGVKTFIYLSSTSGYPNSRGYWQPFKETVYHDYDPPPCYFGVGHVKRYTEKLCAFYAEHVPTPMRTVALRLTNVYGPGDDFNPATSHVTAALIRKIVERQTPLDVWGDGTTERDLVYVDDVVQAIVAALSSAKPGYRAFNIGSGESVPLMKLIHEIARADGLEGELVIETHPEKPTMAPIRRVDVSKARQELGWSATIPREQGLARTIAWYREQMND